MNIVVDFIEKPGGAARPPGAIAATSDDSDSETGDRVAISALDLLTAAHPAPQAAAAAATSAVKKRKRSDGDDGDETDQHRTALVPPAPKRAKKAEAAKKATAAKKTEAAKNAPKQKPAPRPIKRDDDDDEPKPARVKKLEPTHTAPVDPQARAAHDQRLIRDQLEEFVRGIAGKAGYRVKADVLIGFVYGALGMKFARDNMDLIATTVAEYLGR